MKHPQKFLQQRKFFMVLPLLVTPFLIMIFWALGGGKGTPAQAQMATPAGLNLELPDAQFQQTPSDKLSLYREADRDSVRSKESWENDLLSASPLPKIFGPHHPQSQLDANEKKVNDKLDQLYRELNKPSTLPYSSPAPNPVPTDPHFTHDVEKLEQLMEMMKTDSTPDREVQQLEGMLDKILDIQHPTRVLEKQRAQRQQHSVAFDVKPVLQSHTSLLTTESITPQSGQEIQSEFLGLDAQQPVHKQIIEAVVHDTQEVVSGSMIRLRLRSDVTIAGVKIPANQFIVGICSVSGERLLIDIASIRTETDLLPVSLSVFDLDGLEGIYIPGAISREVAKESTGQALEAMQFVTLNPSLSAQAASAGLQAATGLFSRKARLVKVTVKAGYKVLLSNPNQ